MKNPFSNLFRRTPTTDSAQPVPTPPAEKPQVEEEDEERSAIKRLRWLRKEAGAELLMAALGKQAKEEFNQQAAIKSIFPRDISFFQRRKDDKAGMKTYAVDGAIATGGPVGSKSGVGARSGANCMTKPVMNDKVLQHFQNRGFIGWQTCAILAQHEIISRACAIPAEEAIAHGYKLVCSSMEHDQTQTHDADEARWLFEIKRYSDRMGMNDTCIQLNYKKKVFGVGLAIPRIKDVNYELPFNIDGVKEGSYEGFAVVDPYWLMPEFDDASQSDPTSPSFYDPTWYRMPNGQRVHKSWVIRCVNAHVPDILKPTYYFGGIPLPQMIYERVFCADKIANEAPLLAMTKRLLIADANVEELYKDNAHASKMMRSINYFRDNFSIFFKKPSSQVQQIDTSLGEFDQLIMTQYQLVSCIAQMPATKLLKVTPTGFQSTGEYEWKDYAQSLLDIQNNDYGPLLRMHYQLLLRSLYPDRRDLSVEVIFNPIDVPTKNDTATIEARVAQLVNTLIQAGVITPDEGRHLLRTEDQGMFGFLSPIMPDVLKKMMDAKVAQQTQGVGGGMMPGGMMGGGMPPGGGMPSPDAGGDAGGDDGQEYSAAFTEAVKQAQQIANGQGGGDDGAQG